MNAHTRSPGRMFLLSCIVLILLTETSGSGVVPTAPCSGLTDPLQISEGGGTSPDMKIDRLGNAHIVWMGLDYSLWYARVGVEGLKERKKLADDLVSAPRIALDASGDAHVVAAKSLVNSELIYRRIREGKVNASINFTRFFLETSSTFYEHESVGDPSIAINPVTQMPVIGARIHGSFNEEGAYYYDNYIGTFELDSAAQIASTWFPYVAERTSSIGLNARFPEVAVDKDGGLHCVWLHGSQTGAHVQYATSSDFHQGGVSISPSNLLYTDGRPRCEIVGENLYIIWAEGGDFQAVWTRRINTTTLSIEEPVQRSEPIATPRRPAIALLNVGWVDDREGTSQVYSYDLLNETSEKNVSCSSLGSGNFSLAAAAGKLAYAYQDAAAGRVEIFYRQVQNRIDGINPVHENLIHGDGTITTDKHRLADRDFVQADGLTADGVTRLLLRVETQEAGIVRFRLEDENGPVEGIDTVGSLSLLGSSEEAFTCESPAMLIEGDKHMAFAILRAPTNFVRRGIAADSQQAFRPIRIRATFTPVDEEREEFLDVRQLQLYRPPVVLLHGLWSDKSTWSWPLLDDHRFEVHAHDYRFSNAGGFDTNKSEPKKATQIALNRLWSKRIAAVQVDFVGHSMGGILARQYVSLDPATVVPNLRYSRPDNYFAGDIHKLITLATPHRGSELADVLMQPDGSLYLAGYIFQEAFEIAQPLVPNDSFGLCVTCGAVADLRTYSNPINQLAGAIVPAHAIVATGGKELLDAIEEFGDIVPNPYAQALLKVLKFTSILVFGDDFHDLLVKENSQSGGLAAAGTTRFGVQFSPPPEWGVHFSVTGENRISQRVIELLNAGVTGGDFALSGFPASSRLRGASILSAAGAAVGTFPSSFVDGISIQTVVPGTNVSSGSHVTLKLVAKNSFEPVKLLVIGPFGAELVNDPPFEPVVTVPTNWLGALPVKAFAVDKNGIYAEAEEIVLEVSTSASLTNIVLSLDTIYLFEYSPTQPVEFIGQFTDGISRKLPPSYSPRLTVIDPTIATVTDGSVHALRNGKTTLFARLGTLSATANIEVIGTPFTNAPLALNNTLEVVDLGSSSDTVPIALNNSGQIVLWRSQTQNYALWENGTLTALNGYTASQAGSASLTDSGVVGIRQSLWFTPSNPAFISVPSGQGADQFAIRDIADSLSGLIGIVQKNRPSPYWLLSETAIPTNSVSITGLPPGYTFSDAKFINTSGLIAAEAVKTSGDTETARIVLSINANNQLSILSGLDQSADVQGLNNLGEMAGSWPQGRCAVFWKSNGQVVTITNAPGARAHAINNRSHVALRWGDPIRQTGIWSDGRIVNLDDLLNGEWSSFGEITGLNDEGWLICSARSKTSGTVRRILIKLAPRIGIQPVNHTKVVGQTVTFKVLDYAFGKRLYQWRKNGTNLVNGDRISGADTAEMTISNVAFVDAGEYSLTLQDDYGYVVSSNATLEVFADCVPFTNSPFAWWTADTFGQEVLNRWQGNTPNQVLFGQGIVGTAFRFDGTSNYFKAGELIMPIGSMPVTTWEAWVYPTHIDHGRDQYIFTLSDNRNGGGNPSPARAVYIARNSNKFRINGATIGGLFNDPWPGVEASVNEWQHIAVVYDANQNVVEFYKNGERFVPPSVAPNRDSTLPLHIGGVPVTDLQDGNFFQGMIDEVMIHNRKLSADEIRMSFDAGAEGRCLPEFEPEFLTHPASQTAYQGQSVEFRIRGVGSAPMTYHWQHNGNQITTPVAGAFGGVLRLSDVAAENAGDYACVLSNAYGSVTSRVARLNLRGACDDAWRLASTHQTWPDLPLAVFDEKRQITVAISGNEVWEWDGTQTVRRSEIVTATNRTDFALTFDGKSGVVLLFGGVKTGILFNDTWSWNGTQWQPEAASGPSPRRGSAMAYDPVRQQVVLFGGLAQVAGGVFSLQNDTWVWDGGEWTERLAPLSGSLPSPRQHHRMVFDPTRGKIVLFGGITSADGATDTWEWDGVKWQQIPILFPPTPATTIFGLAYDVSRGTVIRHGGETWELVESSWVKIPVSGSVVATSGSLVYDRKKGALLFFDNNNIYERSTPRVPQMRLQPTSEIVRYVGERAILEGCATGQGVLSWLWTRDGTGIDMEGNGSILLIPRVEARDSGSYRLTVSNEFGSASSSPAAIRVKPCEMRSTELTAWWRAEGDVMSAVGLQTTETFGGVGFAVGKVGQSFKFDGEDDYVVASASTNINFTEDRGFTVEAWINPNDLNGRPVFEWNTGVPGVTIWISKSDAGGGPGSLFANVKSHLTHVDHKVSTTTNLIASGQWSHVAVTYDRAGGTISLYVNGLQRASTFAGTFRSATSGDFYVGYQPGSTNLFAGLIDEASLYRRVLSAEEIQNIYRSGANGKCSAPDGAPYVYLDGVNYTNEDILIFTDEPVEVAVLPSIIDGTVHYSLDGTNPEAGAIYQTSLFMTNSFTIRAQTSRNGIVSGSATIVRVRVFPAPQVGIDTIFIVSVGENGVQTAVAGESGRRYILERSTDLDRWETVSSGVAPIEGGLLHLLDRRRPDTAAFFRAGRSVDSRIQDNMKLE